MRGPPRNLTLQPRRHVSVEPGTQSIYRRLCCCRAHTYILRHLHPPVTPHRHSNSICSGQDKNACRCISGAAGSAIPWFVIHEPVVYCETHRGSASPVIDDATRCPLVVVGIPPKIASLGSQGLRGLRQGPLARAFVCLRASSQPACRIPRVPAAASTRCYVIAMLPLRFMQVGWVGLAALG